MNDKQPQCTNCKYLKARNLCGFDRSPFYQETVEADDSCQFFAYNPAQGHLNQGILLSVEDDHLAAIEQFKKALQGSLPEDDELAACSFLADSSGELIDTSLEQSALLESQKLRDRLEYMERAVEIDRSGQYDYFADPLNRARLRPLDFLYAYISKTIEESKGVDESIRFLERKIQLFDYLPSSPLLSTLLTLGANYSNSGHQDKALHCFERIIEASPVDPVDENGMEQQTRRMAQENVRLMKRGHGNQKACFVASASLGSPSHPSVVQLRDFRDRVLLRHPTGRRIVNYYYKFSPPLARFLERCSPARVLARALLINPIIIIIEGLSLKERR